MATDALSRTFSALADPTRRAILSRLNQGEATVGEIAEPFNLSLPGISKHIKVLEKAGLIERSKQAQWRRCRLRPESLKPLDSWLEEYRKNWDESLDRLEEYVHGLKQQEGKQEDA